MKKISIAQRRIETGKRSRPPVNRQELSDRPSLFEHSTRPFPARLLELDNKNLVELRNSEEEILEIGLKPSHRAMLDSILKGDHNPEFSARLRKISEGTLIIDLSRLGEVQPRFVSARTVAGMLDVSVRTVYRLHSKRELKGIRIGRSLRFAFNEVLDFLEACRES